MRITFLPLILSLLSTISYGQVVSPNPYLTDIRQVDFKNFTFSRSNDAAEKIQFRNGEYVGAEGLHYSLMRFAYGDLTGDSHDEAVILVRGQNTPISRTLDEVFIYTIKNGKAVLLTSFEGGKRGDYICSVIESESNFKVEGQTLIIDQAVALGNDNRIPTRYYTIKYRWNDSRMEEVERSDLKLLPEHRTEIG